MTEGCYYLQVHNSRILAEIRELEDNGYGWLLYSTAEWKLQCPKDLVAEGLKPSLNGLGAQNRVSVYWRHLKTCVKI